MDVKAICRVINEESKRDVEALKIVAKGIEMVYVSNNT